LKKFSLLRLDRRARDACEPEIRIVDLRNRPMQGALSPLVLEAMEAELDRNNQVMLFLNRRGFSPVIMCPRCAWAARCDRCDVHMTWHKQRQILLCHRCDRRQRLMPRFRSTESGSLFALAKSCVD